MKLKTIFVFSFILFSGLSLMAQKNKKVKTDGTGDEETKQKVFVTIGPEINLVIPTDFGVRRDSLFQDTLVKFYPTVSYRLGACLRFDFSRTFSFQTGLYYINRSYTVEIGKTDLAAQPLEITEEYYSRNMNYTGFEIPLMGLFYVQLGKKWFMNNAVGVSIDFFPSSIVKPTGDSAVKYVAYGGRNSWCIPSLKAAIGFEFRTDNSGYFYLGGQFHRPFVGIFDGYTERPDINPYGPQTTKIPQSGTYFSIDFKYFFPTGKKNKFTESVR